MPDLLSDLEKAQTEMKAAGVDTIVNVTTDPADLLAQTVEDEGCALWLYSPIAPDLGDAT